MKTKRQHGSATVTIHAILAGLALIFAYMTWTRDRTVIVTDSVVALDVNKRDVTALQYEDENRTVTVERRSGSDGEPYAWVTVKTRSKTLNTNPGGEPRVAMPPGHGPGAPPSPPTAPPAPVPAPPGAASKAPGAAPAPAPGAGPVKSAPAAKPAPGVKPAPAPAPLKGGDKSGVDKNKPAPVPGSAPAPVGAAPGPAPVGAAPGPAPGATPAAGAAPGAAPAAGPAPAAAPGVPIHEVKETITVKQFRGSDQADKLLDLFGPLRAVRALGTVDEAKAKELGFTDSKKSLTVTARGQSTKFVLGGTSYGVGDVYARDPEGRVFLISQRLPGDLEFAESRMMERRLHRFERPEFDRLEVTVTTASGPKKRVLLQRNKQDAANYFFAEESSPDKRDDTLRNWVEKVMRMAISDYVAQGEEPQPSTTAPMSGTPQMGDLITLRFFDGRRELGSAVLSRYQNPKTNQMEFFARTETTIGLVKLLTATAESAVQDAEKW